MNAKPVIVLDDLTKQYPNGKCAVDHLSFSVEPGSLVALLGPNGAGKSTTISMLLGLQQPTRGKVKLLGGSPREAKVRGKIGAMLQDSEMVPGLKVREAVDLFRHYYSHPMDLGRLLRIAGLDEVQDKMASSLSGGQKRRMAFALALAGDPEVLFLDEPTVGMDVMSRQMFWDTVRTIQDQGKTIMLTTHYLEEADQLADRILVVNEGRLIADGSPAEMKQAAGRKSIHFTAGPELQPRQLEQLPGVQEAVWNGRRVKLTSLDTDRVIFTMVHMNLDVRDIEIQTGGLEEAFRNLVQGNGSTDRASETNKTGTKESRHVV
ncbi:ABC transporter ATP-binding protein [Paenibacillus physcomitrellae]|uniref:ABC transporter ATP-binding protein n=1 Tax=Paenibacillus physcomitrellae TaxID=1619311 RepID=A0ABQ1FZ22_9BACL|nr:ABC transporter ATP-binding protein [Paenibacillus physcomitrellae]GGA33683.1 ABC transporter ATP-binding protein [Paenibacillus physcomitrellae]